MHAGYLGSLPGPGKIVWGKANHTWRRRQVGPVSYDHNVAIGGGSVRAKGERKILNDWYRYWDFYRLMWHHRKGWDWREVWAMTIHVEQEVTVLMGET